MQIRDAGKVVEFIVDWLRRQVNQAGARGIVVGLSGGIDSAVVAALGRRAFGRDMLAVIMPCHNIPSDAEDARLVAEALDIPFRTVDLGPACDALTSAMAADGLELPRLAGANLKARLRMCTLYAAAQSLSFLVCGTGNRSEYETGYFTKFGDSASDLLPLANLLKCEVRTAARVLGIPERIIEKAPSAGLWEGQTDEGEMGFSYEDLDRYLFDGTAKDEDFRQRVEAMRRRSAHKRAPVPICIIPE